MHAETSLAEGSEGFTLKLEVVLLDQSSSFRVLHSAEADCPLDTRVQQLLEFFTPSRWELLAYFEIVESTTPSDC